ncbi:MAG: hypothetical protein H7X97_08815 [Opitutaceae bacterium]|nr:hypothetical protein [Verrucomicrobiales bacterium]
MGKPTKSLRWQAATVLHEGAAGRQLWQFAANNGQFNLLKEQLVPGKEPLPDGLVGKSWRQLVQPKMNIGWLPADKVFLRVLQLPVAEFDELRSMVELQLEQLAPMPVNQLVWSIELLPRAAEGNLQTVILVIAERILVEQFLGQLESQGFVPDRLDVPSLDLLLSTKAREDGVWVYPGDAPTAPTLVAWWYGGTLQNLTLLPSLPGPEKEARFKEQVAQIAWSGELEGWLTGPPAWHLVAEGPVAAFWEPLLRSLADQPVHISAAPSNRELAASSARRAVQSRSPAGLLPEESFVGFKQRFIDRLWMRGLGAVLMIYVFGVLVYFGALEVVKFKHRQLQTEMVGISQSYTNAIMMRDKLKILDEQAALKFAALDCWKIVAESLPEGVILKQLNFSGGRRMTLSGEADTDAQQKVLDFSGALGRATINGQPITADVPSISVRGTPGGASTIVWSLNCRLSGREE